jgi:hypothetical protein
MYSDGISDAKVALLRQVWTLHATIVVVRKKNGKDTRIGTYMTGMNSIM